MEEIQYSDKLIEHASTHVFGLGKSKVILWKLRPPFLWDVKDVFKQTLEEDEELLMYYETFLEESMTRREMVRAIAQAVNARLTYKSDTKNWGKAEYWAKAIETHRKKIDDCDGYAVLLCKVLRLFGFAPWEVFVRAGVVQFDDGTFTGHAHVMWYDFDTEGWYPVEGSMYPKRVLNGLGVTKMEDSLTYTRLETWFITNDKLSYSGFPIKLV